MLLLSLTILYFNYLEMYFVQSVQNNGEYHFPEKFNLEKQLKNKFVQKNKSEERFRQLNERLAEDTAYFEEIPHFAANSSKNIKIKQTNIVNDFKKVIGMVGVKYTYKRDSYWRTWREVAYSNKTEVICYRCHNIIESDTLNCTNCNQGGYWIIENSRPPCSYDIFSFKNEDELCVADFWQLNKANLSSCPYVIPYQELSQCGIPIVTNFLVTKDYSKGISERTSPLICQGRERCDISTVYVIRPKSIVFRIINATNTIIYSKIMNNNGKNYVCVQDCGNFDYNTMTAKRNEDHLLLDLLNPSKKKRDNPKSNYRQNKKAKKVYKEHEKSEGAFSKKKFFIVKKRKYILEQPLYRNKVTTDKQPSMCKRILLQELMNNLGDEHFQF